MGCCASTKTRSAVYLVRNPVLTPGKLSCGPWLKYPEDLDDFPDWPQDRQQSLLCKHLTREVWDKLKDTKDESGVSFKLCILSGCQNVDSGVGVYAGSHSSYKCFSSLFDNIIEEYHGHSKTSKHVSDMDASKLNCPPLSEDKASMIISTRIRVGRNLEGYPLGPGITKEQRIEVMEKIVEACSKFTGDLAGKFYALDQLSEDQKKSLVADHFLFKQGDRFLQACGLNRDWPSGRGIFHNDLKTFLVWINEEDQLRIISMEKGFDLQAVFDRLARAAQQIENVVKFSQDDHLGYITSCPTNLGTAMRASVHIKLPNLSKDMTAFQALAEKFNLQIRGIHGEHSESVDGVYDISNKIRLGRSEKDLVQDLYNGVKALISAERALTGECSDFESGVWDGQPHNISKSLPSTQTLNRILAVNQHATKSPQPKNGQNLDGEEIL